MHLLDLGFTATRGSLTKAQAAAVRLPLCAAKTVRHGDCRGGDAHIHRLTLIEKRARTDPEDTPLRIIIHPGDLPFMRAHCGSWDEIHPEKRCLDRNHDIVDACDMLVALPKEGQEQLRSGTWATIRYARKQKKLMMIIYPDGAVWQGRGDGVAKMPGV